MTLATPSDAAFWVIDGTWTVIADAFCVITDTRDPQCCRFAR
jgi:hypothetical protein